MTDTSSTTARPRARRLQFSLRLLLLAFTAFAIGFPIWYRWPYEEVAFESPPGSPTELKRITTWQRQWGGGKLKHGLQRFVRNGITQETTTYRNGLRHGPYVGKDRNGQVVASGQYLDDLKEGVWTAPDRTATWRRGKLNGPYELRLPPISLDHPIHKWRSRKSDQATGPQTEPAANQPRVFQLVFADGRLTHFNGQPASNRLFDLMATDEIEKRTRNELDKFTQLDVIEMPLKDIVLYLTEVHQIPIVLDPVLSPKADMPITDEYRDVELASVLLLITAPRGLACDYRYGCLWITSAEDAKDWHDPTGISDIKPPKDSALARAWNEPTAIGAVDVSLASALDYFQDRLAIHIDTTQIQPTAAQPLPFPVTLNIKSLPFHHLLGQLLYQSGCRCRLEGETLVILPPQDPSMTGTNDQ